MTVIDFKKQDKSLYLPSAQPGVIDVPKMSFIMVEGEGDPNTAPAYLGAVEALYGLSYAIKMRKMGDDKPEGYFDYVVGPLEGLWWFKDGSFDGNVQDRKDDFVWVAMIRQPDFVTPEVFDQARETLAKKKPGLDTSRARLEEFTEGLCAQVMHLGPYDDEPATVAKLDAYIEANGYRTKVSGLRQHHEIYLSDPRRTAPEKMKTVLRHPIVKV